MGTPLNALSSTIQKTDAVCGTGGSIIINGAGGTLPYTYSINGSRFQLSNTFTNVAAGTYNAVTIKDSKGCTAVAIVNSDSYEVFINERQSVNNLNTTI